jgi:integrase
LGKYGSPESKTAYARFLAEKDNPIPPAPNRFRDSRTGWTDNSITVEELTAAFLQDRKPEMHDAHFSHYTILCRDFLLSIYGDIPAERFGIRELRTCQQQLISSRRFCRNTVNDYVKKIVALFRWGANNAFVPPAVYRDLQAIIPVKRGTNGTFDHKPRREVPDDVVEKTLPFLPPMLRAMVTLQRMKGMRPSEVCNMKAGEIDRSAAEWTYTPAHHKTEEDIGEKTFYFGAEVQSVLAPYLTGRKPADYVFTPATAMRERKETKRQNRKSKIPPSQAARAAQRAKKPVKYHECYDHTAYKRAIERAVAAANKTLPPNQQIPHWTPYQLRHARATELERIGGLDAAQAELCHRTANVTRRYSHAQEQQRRSLALREKNPYALSLTRQDAQDRPVAKQGQ